MAKALIPLAQGCEELEAVTIIDILRRADIEVITAGLDADVIIASRGVKLIADTQLDKVLHIDFDIIILPGGLPGSDHLNNDMRIHQLIADMTHAGHYAAAICAAPKVLANAGVLDGKTATSYPNVLEVMDLPNVTIDLQAVIQDGNIITSRGPGTAMDFALKIVEVLCGEEKRASVELALVR